MIDSNIRRRADAVIYGGFTALLLAAGLAEHGMHIIVLYHDELQIPSGAAAIWGCPALSRIRTTHGIDAARSYAAALSSQLNSLIEARPPYIRIVPALLCARTEEELPLLDAQLALMQELHLPVQRFNDMSICPFPVRQALSVPEQACADMSRWKTGLCRHLRNRGNHILPDHRILDIGCHQIQTTAGELNTPMLIFAGEAPFGLRSSPLLSLLESRLLIHTHLTAVQMLECLLLPLQRDEMMLLPAADGADFLCGGGKTGTAVQKCRLKQMEHILSQRLSDWQPGPYQTGRILTSSDGLPVIGTAPDTFHGMQTLFAAGYDEYGIPGAMHAASVLMRLILGHASKEDRLYTPDRAFSIKQKPMLRFPPAWLRRGSPACPHCRHLLRFGEMTDNWECAYCGSAFDLFGHILYGPARHNAYVSPRQRPI